MDMMYHRYSCPMDLIYSYINRGRFGEFVSEFLKSEHDRQKTEMGKDEDLKLWIMYCHSFSEDSFLDWKKKVLRIGNNGQSQGTDADLTEKDIKAICDDLFELNGPSNTTGRG